MTFNYNNKNYLSLNITWVSSLHLHKKDSECNSTYVEFCAILHCLHVPADAAVLCFIEIISSTVRSTNFTVSSFFRSRKSPLYSTASFIEVL